MTHWNFENMFNTIKKKLIDEFRRGCLNLPEGLVPIICYMVGAQDSIKDNEIQEARNIIDLMIDDYNRIYPNAWKGPSNLNNDDIFSFYNGFKKDRKTVAYLDIMKIEIENIVMSQRINSYICKSI